MSGDLIEAAEAMLPGPELAALLASLDDTVEPVRVVVLWERVKSWIEAQELRRTATLVDDHAGEWAWRSAEADLSVALTVGPVSAGQRLGLARELVTELPATMAALDAGALTLAKARVIAEQTRELDPGDRAVVEQRVLGAAGAVTGGQLRRRVRRPVLIIDPDAVVRRRVRTVADRHVRLSPPDPDGMATLSGLLTHDEGLRAMEAVRVHAEAQDCCQADALMSLLTGGLAPTVTLIVRATSDGPVSVPGIGPLDVATLTGLLTDAGKIVIRPITAPPAEARYRPSARMRDYVTATQPACRFPHCHQPARRCDLDHVIPWQTGGITSADGLIPLCRYHHRLKTFTDWTPVIEPDRSITWTDPHGNKHTDPPPD